MKYRNKPVTVEAVLWSGPWEDGELFPHVKQEEHGVATKAQPSEVRFYVTTIHGQRAYLAPGDYLIQEPDGVHWYPCKPDIFAARYEPAE